MSDEIDPEVDSEEAAEHMPSIYFANVLYFRFIMTQDYLYKVYCKKIKEENIKVFETLGIFNIFDPTLRKISPSYQHDGMQSFGEQAIYFFIEFNSKTYIVSLMKLKAYDKEDVIYSVGVEGMNSKCEESFELYKYIKKASTQNSPLKGNIIEITNKDFKNNLLDNINIREKPNVELKDIYYPEKINFSIRRMIFEITNYSRNQNTLRYLLNGNPGTGKTQLISAIINSTFGKITTIILQGTDFDFNIVFEFCSFFNPCLLVIDDLDFIAHNRDSSISTSQLNDFLHALDGIYSTSIFLIAATNDKGLVDLAASRPGRFDLIIDFGHLNPENYIQLIKRETKDEEIIELFTNEILRDLSDKKVTGAYIVNMIKQIKSIKIMKEEFNRKDLLELIDYSYDGFYDINEKSIKKVVGF